MDLISTPDIYEPSITDDGKYTDATPSFAKFRNGIRCPCGTRKEHVFDSRQSFCLHIKTKTHQKWLNDLTLNKMNYFVESERLKEIVNSQKLIIAKMELELNNKMKTIDYLSNQLMNKSTNGTLDLMSFD